MTCCKVINQRIEHITLQKLLSSRVLSDILLALDSSNIAVFALLDLSAAFVSVDHATLLQHLQTSYGLGGSVIAWFTSCLNNQTNTCSYLQAVWVSQLCCTESHRARSLDQSCSYCTLPTCCISCESSTPHTYADDTQIYRFCHLSNAKSLQKHL